MEEQTKREPEGLCKLEDGCLFRSMGFGVLPVPVVEHITRAGLNQLRVIVAVAIALLLAIGGLGVFVTYYPFKTVMFEQPIKVTNPRIPGKQPVVPKSGIVDMTIYYEKFTGEPSLIICTLIRREADGSMVVLDSNTRTAHRPVGKGVTYAHYHLNGSSNLPGKNTHVVFSIYYTLFGFKQVMAPQFETEPFEITNGEVRK